jgi:hypothetical protein
MGTAGVNILTQDAGMLHIPCGESIREHVLAMINELIVLFRSGRDWVGFVVCGLLDGFKSCFGFLFFVWECGGGLPSLSQFSAPAIYALASSQTF